MYGCPSWLKLRKKRNKQRLALPYGKKPPSEQPVYWERGSLGSYFHSAASAFLVSVSKKKVSCLKQAPADLKSELALPNP